jgi:aminodeoxyfutalosine deaminase
MRKISADYIFTIATEPLSNATIIVDDEGTILEINTEADLNHPDTEYYKGIICPGFINTHCHLELSYLRSQISEKTGMTGFISELMAKRVKFSENEIQEAMRLAETEMIENGIVAVADISNNNSSFRQKANRNLFYHTFIEIFSMDPDKANEIFLKGLDLEKQLTQLNLSSSIVPHAPYTMSLPLLELINEHAKKNKNILSIHNQESKAESELFISGSGPMFETFKGMGINMDLLRKTGLNSLKSTLPYLSEAEKILLVHNTYTTKEDLNWIRSDESNLKAKNIYWCTCPNANLFIENKLPDYKIFLEEGVKMTVGTDSLASNHRLSILDELKTILKYNPEISFNTILAWATKNGADFLGLDNFGTIEKGKKPGLNLLQNVEGMNVLQGTSVKKLI